MSTTIGIELKRLRHSACLEFPDERMGLAWPETRAPGMVSDVELKWVAEHRRRPAAARP